MASLSTAVLPHGGVPTLFVNGAPHSGAMYTTFGLKEALIRDFAGVGVRLFAIDSTVGCHYYRFSADVWKAPDTFDFGDLDRRIELILRACPDALVVLRVYVGSPVWWDEAHPNELMRLENGEPLVEHNDFAWLAGIDLALGPVKHTMPSFSSEVWRADAERALETYVRHVETRFGPHIAGYLLESGGTEEWYYWGVFGGLAADYSEPQRHAFEAWAPARGLEVSGIPSVQRRRTATRGFFRDPDAERDVIEYQRFHNEVVANFLLDCARVVKTTCNRRKVVGAFYGYNLDLCRKAHVWPDSGHLALDRVLRSDDLDFLVSPSSYIDRRPGEGAAFLGGALASVALHGKLWWNENDQYTHLTPQTTSTFYLRAKDSIETIQMHRREIAQSVVQGVPQWWFDMHGGWFADAELMSEIELEHRALVNAVDSDRTSLSEVVLVIDYASPLYTETDNRLYQLLIRDLYLQLSRTGAPFDVACASDLSRIRDYRYYVLANAFVIDRETEAALTRIASRGDAHLLWLYAPGYADGGVERVSQLVGMSVVEHPESAHASDEERTRAVRATVGSALFVPSGANPNYGPAFPLEPRLSARGGAVLATYADGSGALVRIERDAGSSTFAAVPGLPGWVLRQLMQAAGVHVYSDAPDQVWACRDWFAISFRESGQRNIALREPGRYLDVFSGRTLEVGAAGALTIDAKKGDTLLLRHLGGSLRSGRRR